MCPTAGLCVYSTPRCTADISDMCGGNAHTRAPLLDYRNVGGWPCECNGARGACLSGCGRVQTRDAADSGWLWSDQQRAQRAACEPCESECPPPRFRGVRAVLVMPSHRYRVSNNWEDSGVPEDSRWTHRHAWVVHTPSRAPHSCEVPPARLTEPGCVVSQGTGGHQSARIRRRRLDAGRAGEQDGQQPAG